MKTLLVLTALPSEISAVVGVLEHRRTDTWGDVAVHEGDINGCRVVALATGVGKVRASAGAQYAIGRFAPNLVMVVGAAGALDTGLHRGQVVIGERVVEHDFDMSPLAADPAVAFRTWLTGADLARWIADAAGRVIGDRNVTRGTILTGDQAVVDSSWREQLRTKYEALCIEMEGAAVAAVCHQNRVPFVLVRVVTDSADRAASQQFVEHLPAVSMLSRRIVEQILRADDLELATSGVPRLDSRSPVRAVAPSIPARSGPPAARQANRRMVGVERVTWSKDCLRRYGEGDSIRKIAADTGRSYGFVHRILKEAGAQLRSRGGARNRRPR
jgi:adenosylhomocysteine nucleosidase